MMTHDNDTDARKELPAGWRWARLGEVCDINPSRPKDFKRATDTLTTFIPMAAVDGDLGQIVAPQQRLYEEVSRGYTYFAEGDVLFAKITPCMQNKKSAIARQLIDGVGFGTTEFHVLRPHNEILAEWIYYQLREPTFLSLAEANFSGAVGQQRVPTSFVEQYHIPLPPLATQRAIARRLEHDMAEVARLRAAAERQRVAAAALPSAYLREIFESVEARGWPVVRLRDAGKISSGITLGKTYYGEHIRSVPYLRVANVKDGYLDLSNVYNIEVPERDIKKCRLQFGDLLLTEGGDPDKLGRGTFWESQLSECIHQNHIFRVRFDLNQFFPQFIAYQLQSSHGKAYFLAHAKQTTGIATINQQVLANFPLMVPSFAEQQAVIEGISRDIAEAANLCNEAERQRQAIDAMPAALLREVFGGFAG